VASPPLPAGCVGLVAGGGREELAELATQRDTVDLIIRVAGGAEGALEQVATVPVIYAALGQLPRPMWTRPPTSTRPRRS